VVKPAAVGRRSASTWVASAGNSAATSSTVAGAGAVASVHAGAMRSGPPAVSSTKPPAGSLAIVGAPSAPTTVRWSPTEVSSGATI
jgi:hypothetical protein